MTGRNGQIVSLGRDLRLNAILIDEFRSLRDTTLPLDALVLLFGANSSGKTTVIDAVRELLSAGKGEMRRDPFGEETGDPYVDGSVVFELVGSGLAGHPDAELHRRLFTGELSNGYPDWPWSFIEEQTVSVIRGQDLDTAQEFIAASYAEMPGPGAKDDRILLAGELVRTRFCRSTWTETSLVAFPDELSAEARVAAERIAVSGEVDDDPLAWQARALCDGKAVSVASVADGFVESDEIRSAFGGFIDINAETGGLLATVSDDIAHLHDLLWSIPDEPETPDALHIVPVDAYLIEGFSGGNGTYGIDPWLEAQGQDRNDVLFGYDPEAGDALRWHRVKPSLIAAAQMLEDHANRIAPTFVTDLGRIRVNVLPLALWRDEPSRVRVAFEEAGRRRDLAVLGSGVARWVAASLRLAGRELRANDRLIRDEQGSVIVEVDRQRAAVNTARSDPRAQTTVSLQPRASTTPVTHLVDEPEAHLHPKAVSSISDWLCGLVDRGHQVVIATHHVGLVTALATRARLILTSKRAGTSTLSDITDDVHAQLESANAELGLTAGELLLLTRFALFVEGPHDQAVLLGMFGNELLAAGVKVFPLHGIDNALAIVESEVISSLGIRMGVLGDNIDRQRIGTGAASTYEERATLRLLEEAKRSGKVVSPFGLLLRDIVEYLDDDVCRTEAPGFPGWVEAVRLWNEGRRPTAFKPFVTERFGLRLDRGTVHRLAVDTALAERVPVELAQVVRTICARASSA